MPCQSSRDRAELRPVKRAVHRDHVAGGQQRVLLVAAVIVAAHATHRREPADTAPGTRYETQRQIPTWSLDKI